MCLPTGGWYCVIVSHVNPRCVTVQLSVSLLIANPTLLAAPSASPGPRKQGHELSRSGTAPTLLRVCHPSGPAGRPANGGARRDKIETDRQPARSRTVRRFVSPRQRSANTQRSNSLAATGSHLYCFPIRATRLKERQNSARIRQTRFDSCLVKIYPLTTYMVPRRPGCACPISTPHRPQVSTAVDIAQRHVSGISRAGMGRRTQPRVPGQGRISAP